TPKDWLKDSINDKTIVEFNSNLFENIEQILSSSNVKKAYLKESNTNIVLKYVGDNRYKK
ncbi:52_t:CDS:1, partial [Acaulospora colombiana]